MFGDLHQVEHGYSVWVDFFFVTQFAPIQLPFSALRPGWLPFFRFQALIHKEEIDGDSMVLSICCTRFVVRNDTLLKHSECFGAMSHFISSANRTSKCVSHCGDVIRVQLATPPVLTGAPGVSPWAARTVFWPGGGLCMGLPCGIDLEQASRLVGYRQASQARREVAMISLCRGQSVRTREAPASTLSATRADG